MSVNSTVFTGWLIPWCSEGGNSGFSFWTVLVMIIIMTLKRARAFISIMATPSRNLFKLALYFKLCLKDSSGIYLNRAFIQDQILFQAFTLCCWEIFPCVYEHVILSALVHMQITWPPMGIFIIIIIIIVIDFIGYTC